MAVGGDCGHHQGFEDAAEAAIGFLCVGERSVAFEDGYTEWKRRHGGVFVTLCDMPQVLCDCCDCSEM